MDQDREYKVLLVDNDCPNAIAIRRELDEITAFKQNRHTAAGVTEACWILEQISIDFLIIDLCGVDAGTLYNFSEVYDRAGTTISIAIQDAHENRPAVLAVSEKADLIVVGEEVSSDLLSRELVRLRMLKEYQRRPGLGLADTNRFGLDLSTPMTSVIGLSEVMSQYVQRDGLNGGGDSSDFRPFGEKILLASFLEATSLEPDYSFVELRPVLNTVIRTLRKSFSNRKVRLSLLPEVPRVLVLDESKLKQMLNTVLWAALLSSDRATVSLVVGWKKEGETTCDLTFLTGIEGENLSWPATRVETIWDDADNQQTVSAINLRLRIVERIADVFGGELSERIISGDSIRLHLHLPRVTMVVLENSATELRSSHLRKVNDVSVVPPGKPADRSLPDRKQSSRLRRYEC